MYHEDKITALYSYNLGQTVEGTENHSSIDYPR